MKIGYICFGFFVVCVFGVSNANAQDMGIFSGRGIRGPEPNAEPAKSRWPKLLDFSKEEPSRPSVQPFSGLSANRAEPETDKPPKSGFSFPKFEKPSFDWMKKRPSLFEEKEPAKPSSGITSIFPKRDKNRPSMFEQMNTKSKDFLDRTIGWTERKNRKKKERSFETWDAITKDLKSFQNEAPDTTAPAQPPVRSAQGINQPRVRF